MCGHGRERTREPERKRADWGADAALMRQDVRWRRGGAGHRITMRLIRWSHNFANGRQMCESPGSSSRRGPLLEDPVRRGSVSVWLPKRNPLRTWAPPGDGWPGQQWWREMAGFRSSTERIRPGQLAALQRIRLFGYYGAC